MSDDNSHNRFPLRKSVLIWVLAAVIGWAATVIAVYSVIRSEKVITVEKGAEPVPGEVLEPMEPATGPLEPSGPGSPARQPSNAGVPAKGSSEED
jgi:hypothetical protein